MRLPASRWLIGCNWVKCLYVVCIIFMILVTSELDRQPTPSILDSQSSRSVERRELSSTIISQMLDPSYAALQPSVFKFNTSDLQFPAAGNEKSDSHTVDTITVYVIVCGCVYNIVLSSTELPTMLRSYDKIHPTVEWVQGHSLPPISHHVSHTSASQHGSPASDSNSKVCVSSSGFSDSFFECTACMSDNIGDCLDIIFASPHSSIVLYMCI